MKKILIISLIALNAALLAALMFGSATQPAHAQVIGGGTDYIMIPVTMNYDSDGMVIIDIGQQKLTAIRLDQKSQQAVVFRIGRQLSSDFQTGGAPTGRQR